ncbi:hypothetical protein D3C71_2023340 [compost metagenome]
MQSHEGDVEHIGCTEGIPGIEHAILTPAGADAGLQHLGHSRQATALRVGVVAPLKHDVYEWIGDH